MRKIPYRWKGAKFRRRGDRLIVCEGDRRSTYLPFPDLGCFRLIEVQAPRYHYLVSYSPCAKYVMEKGTHDGEPMCVVRLEADGKLLAIKDKRSPWLFPDADNPDRWLASVNSVPFENRALAAGTVKCELDRDLAKFLGVSQCCAASAISTRS